MVVSTGNVMLNATRAVLNQTRDFFQHGVMPKAGLDELDEFILKKIGIHSSFTISVICQVCYHIVELIRL